MSADDKVSGVPDIDSLDVWDALVNNKTSPRSTIALAAMAESDGALINWPWKIVLGKQQVVWKKK